MQQSRRALETLPLPTNGDGFTADSSEIVEKTTRELSRGEAFAFRHRTPTRSPTEIAGYVFGENAERGGDFLWVAVKRDVGKAKP